MGEIKGRGLGREREEKERGERESSVARVLVLQVPELEFEPQNPCKKIQVWCHELVSPVLGRHFLGSRAG